MCIRDSPYIVIGDDQLVDDSNCGEAYEATSTIHVFSRAQGRGKTEAKEIGDAITAALNAATLSMPGFVHTRDDSDPDFRSASYFYEPDGMTAHGVLTFRFFIDKQA
jgi:hypothetical protein